MWQNALHWCTSPPAISACRDRLRRIADGFDIIACIEESDNAARTSFQALITPGERADQRPLVEHELDIAAAILGVGESLLGWPGCKGKAHGVDPTDVL